MAYYLITGANRGIGLELTKQLIKRGDCVVACCRNPEQAKNLEKIALQTNTDRFIFYKLDMTRERDITALPHFLKQKAITVVTVILNAGIAEPTEQLGNITQQQMLNVLNTNTVGPILMIQALTEHLAQSKQNPKIVCISSDLGSISLAAGLIFGLTYSISKAALNMGIKKLTSALASRGISINAIHPGWVQTDLGGQNATLTVKQSVVAMLHVIDNLKLEHSGSFIDYMDKEIPW